VERTPGLGLDGRDAGLELTKEGLAWAYERYLLETSPEIQEPSMLQLRLLRGFSRLGLWQDNEPVSPWEYRKAEREQRAALQRQSP
jgi:endonuclease YncB( thermonuclease family)